MSNWIGGFDHKGSPTLTISVSVPPAGFTEIGAVLNTGFTRFLLLPLVHVDSFLSPLEALKQMTLADGTSVLRLQALVTIKVEGQAIEGIAIIEPDGAEAILGMKFLRGANRSLFVSIANEEVLLIDEVLPQ
jgi:predicted aspartyl protease